MMINDLKAGNKTGKSLFLRSIFFLLSVFFVFIWSCAAHPEPLPEWSHHPPNDPDYWYGLGIGKTRSEARQNAINEISSQISITVSSTLSGIKTEYNFNVNEFTRQVVETRVNSNLNNIELMNSHQSGHTYYILARLSKQKYYDEIDRKKNIAIQQAVSYLKRTRGEFTVESFQYLDYALKEIEPFQDYPLMAEFPENSGNTIMLRPYLAEMVMDFSNRLVCTFSQPEVTMYYGIPDPQRFFVDCVDENTQAQMENIPLILESPENDFTDKILTNSEGFSEVIFRQIYNKTPVQYVRGEVDYTEIVNYFPHRFDTVIGTPLRLSVIGVKIYFTGTEINLGIPLGNPIIEPKLKEICHNTLMAKSTFQSNSDITASYTVQTIKRSSRPEIISGRKIYQTYADISLTFTDTKTGREIFQNTIDNVKGVSYSAFEDAGMDALKKLKNKLSEGDFIDVNRMTGIR